MDMLESPRGGMRLTPKPVCSVRHTAVDTNAASPPARFANVTLMRCHAVYRSGHLDTRTKQPKRCAPHGTPLLMSMRLTAQAKCQLEPTGITRQMYEPPAFTFAPRRMHRHRQDAMQEVTLR